MWATPGAATDEADAAGPDLPRAQDQQKASRAQDISISSQRLAYHPAKPGLVHRHHLHPDAAGVSLPGGRHGLVQSQGPELEAVEHHGCRVLPLSADLPGKSPAGQWCEALKDALARYGPPEIFNSDQGSQFTSTDFTEVLLDAKVKISMDGRGRWPPSHRLQANDCRATDNRMIERLWRSLKYECVYLNAFETGSETRGGIGDWISYYNEKRPHSSHGLLTPAEAYDTQDTNLKAAA